MSQTELIEELMRRTGPEGFAAPIERRWPPDADIVTHTHEFDADAVVTEGEMWLTYEGKTNHLVTGGKFKLPRGLPHSEKYGPQGAVYWVARRSS